MASIKGSDGKETLPSLRYKMNPRVGCLPGGNDKSDVHGKLDKILEHVRVMCQSGAMEFLRHGNCGDEMKQIKEHLHGLLDTATKETEGLQTKEAETAEVSLISRPSVRYAGD